MIIGRSSFALAASSVRQVEQTRAERLRIWEDHQPAPPRQSPPKHPPAGPAIGDSSGISAGGDPGSAGQSDATTAARGRFAVLIALVENLTGRKVRVIDPSEVSGGQGGAKAPAQPPVAVSAGAAGSGSAGTTQGQTRQGWGIDYSSVQTRTEMQHTEFAAAGQVTTTDGRQIDFAVRMTMDRASVEVTSLRFQAGDATMTDPLVLNFGSGPVALSGSKINFDLNSDGSGERISFVADGNGFLALDRNGNGAVDDGSELFGPRTGSGFGELAAYDQDHNGWIDSGDAVFAKLRIWDESDGKLKTLAERGVGAIALANVATAFNLEAGGETAGALRATGVWLGENGQVGTVHHVDLAM